MFVPRGGTPEIEESEAPAAGESMDAEGGRCPVDRTIMSRARVELGGDEPHVHLERCSSCKGVWFDAGEWSSLAERQLLEHLDEFWTAEWRARQRRGRDQENYEKRVREAFGPELYAALQELAGKLKGHERRSQALAFLREASE